MKKILVLHGINPKMLGYRDPVHYGAATLRETDSQIAIWASDLGYEVDCFQTNHEGEMVSKIQKAHEAGIDSIVTNAGAWTHYSYGIADALAIFKGPIVEVHMSNIHARMQQFRHHSVFSHVVKGQICGFGATSYHLGLIAADAILKRENDSSKD